MKSVLFAVAALLTGVLLLMLGSGLQGTLLGIRGAMEGFSRVEIGLMMSAYYAGFAIACLFGGRIIERVGHIRAFAVFTGVASAAAVVHAVMVDPYSWIVLRVVTGACFAALYMVIESWLNGQVTNERRGTVMGVYMIVNLAGMAAAQQLLLLSDPGGFELFVLSSVLFSLAVVPIALTTSTLPAPIPTERMGLRELYAVSPLSVVGALGIGLSNGALWGLVPLAAINFGFTTSDVALLMSLIILGGVVFQWPTGWASDRMDRRAVIAAACGLLVVTCVGLFLTSGGEAGAFLAVSFVFGGMTMVIYPLCSAHLNDRISETDRVRASAAMLLVLGFGAVIGPLLGALAMRYLGDSGLFVYIAAVGTVLFVFVLLRMRDQPPVPSEDQSWFAPVIPSPASNLMDPRIDPDEVDR
ncbi:MAG: MFS transporter [Proteobacteria bacterium]|nr:MFS transporter [Pseudomonadota bacterium]